MPPPNAVKSCCAMGCEGMRMPMLFCPPVTMSLTFSPFGRIKRERTRPEHRRQPFRLRRHLRHPAMQIALMVQVHDHGVVRRTALDLEYLSHCRRVRGVGAESVDRFRRKYHQIARSQRLDGLFDFALCSSYHAPMISNEPLHELQVEPAAELEGDFFEAAPATRNPSFS